MQMREFRDKVAVIIGAASGIGLALARRCAQAEMRVVLVDNNAGALYAAATALQAQGADVLAVPTDVGQARDIEALADATIATFGAVHLLCNNAGVGIVTPILESTVADWEWALNVNLWSVIHAVRVFVPLMRAQQVPCHIVNTASIAGLISPPGLGVYRTIKHAVVAFSEALYHELAANAPLIKVSVLCPGVVKTKSMSSSHRLADDTGDNGEERRLQQVIEAGMAPKTVADHVWQALREERFYILTHPERNWQIRAHMEDILLGQNPSTPLDQPNHS
jgi:NAD(P)-dependent dehydrogenase (short-subunit alcohol dehydrogenase family)